MKKSNYVKTKEKIDKFEKIKKTKKIIPFLSDLEVNIRIYAIRTLRGLKDPIAVDALARIFKETKSDRVHKEVAEALGEIGDPRAVEPLIEVVQYQMRKDYDGYWDYKETIKSAIDALGKIGDPRAIHILINKLSDFYFHYAAEYSLVKLKAIEPLIRALKNPAVQCGAAKALGKIGDPRAVEPLFEALKKDPEYYFADALKCLKAVEPLIRSLKNTNVKVRTLAAKALGEIGDPRAVEPLIEALKDLDLEVRKETTKALGKVKDSRAVEPLIQIFETDPKLRDETAKTLDIIKDPRGIAALDGESLESIVLRGDWARINEKIPKMERESLVELVEPLIKKLEKVPLKELNNYVNYIKLLADIGDLRAAELIIKYILIHTERHLTIGRTEEKWSKGWDYFIDIKMFGDYEDIITQVTHSRETGLSNLSGCGRSDKGIEQLFKLNTPLSISILHILLNREEWSADQYDGNYTGTKSDYFSDVKELIKEKLKELGNPKYDPSIFLEKNVYMIK